MTFNKKKIRRGSKNFRKKKQKSGTNPEMFTKKSKVIRKNSISPATYEGTPTDGNGNPE